MGLEKQIKQSNDVSTLKIILTFILLVLAITGYILVNKYAKVDPTDTENTIVEKTKNDNLSDEDATKLATEKYYMAIATVTNTKTDIDKIYNLIKTSDVILTDQALIDKLNQFGAKSYAVNSSASIISNYEESITNNFTEQFINENILSPNGFIGLVNGEYYLIKDKIENYFFKEAKLNLVSKSETELHFQVIVTKYATSCVSAGSTTPSITCTDTSKTNPQDFNLVKINDKWKVKTLTLVTP